MVVSSNVEVWHFEPQVDVGIVHLALGRGVVLFLSRAGHNDELFAEPDG